MSDDLQRQYTRWMLVGLVGILCWGSAMMLPVFGVRWTWLAWIYWPGLLIGLLAFLRAGRIQKQMRAG